MANNYAKGTYVPVNPEKYVGTRPPIYRSSWESTFMRFCDNHPSVVSWASECVRIPYKNPFTGKIVNYIPDFLVTYEINGVRKAELIEIKPEAQAVMEVARSQSEKAAVVLNMCKWQAARIWCSRMGATFRVLTERDLFNAASSPRKRRK